MQPAHILQAHGRHTGPRTTSAKMSYSRIFYKHNCIHLLFDDSDITRYMSEIYSFRIHLFGLWTVAMQYRNFVGMQPCSSCVSILFTRILHMRAQKTQMRHVQLQIAYVNLVSVCVHNYIFGCYRTPGKQMRTCAYPQHFVRTCAVPICIIEDPIRANSERHVLNYNTIFLYKKP